MRQRQVAMWSRRLATAAALALGLALLGCGGGGGTSGGNNGGNNGGTGQTRTVTGRVTNVLTGNGVSAATVQTSTGQTGTTNNLGNYSLANVPVQDGVTLTVTATGYQANNQVLLANQTVANAALQPAGGTITDPSSPPPPPDFDSIFN